MRTQVCLRAKPLLLTLSILTKKKMACPLPRLSLNCDQGAGSLDAQMMPTNLPLHPTEPQRGQCQPGPESKGLAGPWIHLKQHFTLEMKTQRPVDGTCLKSPQELDLPPLLPAHQCTPSGLALGSGILRVPPGLSQGLC